MRRIAVFLLLQLAVPGVSAGATNEPGPDPGTAGCTRSAGLPVPAVERREDPADVVLDNRVIVSPTSFEFADPIEAGDRFLCTITLRNRYPRTTTLLLEPMGLLGSRSGRATAEYVDTDDPDAERTAAGWISAAPSSVTLEPREVAQVPVVVEVPEDVPVGARYATIDVYSKAEAEAGETVLGVESRVAIPFLFDVGGVGVPDLALTDARWAKLRWSRDPWTLRANLENVGTLHATPQGRVRIRSIFGNTVHELPIAGTPLLPGGRQRVVTTWDDVPWFGFYRFDVRVAPAGDEHGDQVVRGEGWFLALPPWWVLALAAAILLVAIASWVRRRRLARAWGAPEETDEDSFED